MEAYPAVDLEDDFGGLEDLDYEGYQYYDPDSMEPVEHVYERISAADLAERCVVPTMTQGVAAILPLLMICLVSRLTHGLLSEEPGERNSPVWQVMMHMMSAFCGLLAAHSFFETSVIYLVIMAVMPYLQMNVTVRALPGRTGVMTAAFILIFVVSCELVIIGSEDWHKIRGAQMVLAMKVISLGFDLDHGHVRNLPPAWQYAGYLFHPGSIIFGPWASFRDYEAYFRGGTKKNGMYWMLKASLSTLCSLFCLIYSTCLIHWLVLDHWGSWWLAYRDAQGFRFSHYFVSFVSEATATLSGFSWSPARSASMSKEQKGKSPSPPPKTLNSDSRGDFSVVRPFHIELPRSLTEVVSNWNLPMHFWLKNYVFKPSQHLGVFPAIILTYIASSVLHGLNFQLAAVLLSLGFYSYVEHQFRRKLSKTFDACIGAKRCKENCGHTYTSMHIAVLVTNLCFGALSIFHLAYLGLMFDNSEGQEEGYTMQHTLSKWSSLGFASHWVALGTYIIYLLI